MREQVQKTVLHLQHKMEGALVSVLTSSNLRLEGDKTSHGRQYLKVQHPSDSILKQLAFHNLWFPLELRVSLQILSEELKEPNQILFPEDETEAEMKWSMAGQKLPY